MGYDLYNIARGGMSNGGICAQLEFALTFKPDLIIYNSTSPDRIEFPTKNNMGVNLNSSHIAYRYKASTSSELEFLNKDIRIISDTLSNIGSWFDKNVLENLYGKDCSDIMDKQDAVKHYIEHLYCPQWKSQTDILLLYAITHKVLLSGVKFIFMIDVLGCIAEMPWLTSKNIGYNYDLLLNRRNHHINEEFNSKNFKDPGYHTAISTQKEIAEYTMEKIQSL